MGKRTELKVVAHYMMINGEAVMIDPYTTNLPDRCKLVVAELTTGMKHEFSNVGS